jgi:GNAT superfamily N-acetyltransferase
MSAIGRTLPDMSDFEIKALTGETFRDFAALVERNGGMFAGCWCTKFHPDCAEKGQSREGNRAFKQRLVADGVAHAALVYDGDLAIAWAEYGTPEELPGIHHRKEYLATAQRLPDYRITCIQVEKAHRGKGLASVALRGAVDLIAQGGGGVVQGYPHDTGGVRKKNSSFLYNGTRTMYEREGFVYDRPKGMGNCVMVRKVAPSSSS